MSLHIYNSLTRKKEEFIPITPGSVNIYTCGVTVYDDCHIGHARSLYIFDVVRRYLKYRGYKVNFVRNITDIDDKIINRAQELKTDWKALVEKYINRYYEDLKSLNISPGILDGLQEPRATGNIDQIKRYIDVLIRNGRAYVTESGVYFSVRKFKDYGKLSKQAIERMLSGVRKTPDETKDDPLDFALWKAAKPQEPFWESPWGRGRPGWHIECSAMSTKYFKGVETLDIHAGGRDLIFPHHENEIAQSESFNQTPLARYWMHHGLLTINAQKMSKSAGNFITISGFKKQQPLYKLKMFFLSAHYQNPLDYNAEAMHMVSENAKSINIFAAKIKEISADMNPRAGSEEFTEKFINAMDDDFNTSVALSVLLEMVSAGNRHLNTGAIDKAIAIYNSLNEFLNVLNITEIINGLDSTVPAMANVVKLLSLAKSNKGRMEGLGLKEVSFQADDTDAREKLNQLIDNFISLRSNARINKEYKLADDIREGLAEAGVLLEDDKNTTKWRVDI